MDFMKKHKVVIDIGSGKCVINGVDIPLLANLESKFKNEISVIKVGKTENQGELLKILERHLERIEPMPWGRSVATHSIQTEDHLKYTSSPYRYSLPEKKFIEKEIKTMLEKKFCRPSNSEYASPIVLAPKAKSKPNEWRFCEFSKIKFCY